jgi:predicted nuclease of predicted toxin-antitoxin system
LRFLVDAQLPPALARRIEALGYVAEHVADCGLATAADSAIRKYAASTDAVIITKDEDFAVHRLLQSGPPVVWIRIGNTRRAELLRRIEADFSTIIVALERGDTLIEIA